MKDSSDFLLTIGGILLLGLLTSTLARRTLLPRVTLLLLFGILIGKEFLNLIPHVFSDRFDIIADMTLLMVGFLLGGKLTKESLRDSAGEVLWLSISAALLTTLFFTMGLVWAEERRNENHALKLPKFSWPCTDCFSPALLRLSRSPGRETVLRPSAKRWDPQTSRSSARGAADGSDSARRAHSRLSVGDSCCAQAES